MLIRQIILYIKYKLPYYSSNIKYSVQQHSTLAIVQWKHYICIYHVLLSWILVSFTPLILFTSLLSALPLPVFTSPCSGYTMKLVWSWRTHFSTNPARDPFSSPTVTWRFAPAQVLPGGTSLIFLCHVYLYMYSSEAALYSASWWSFLQGKMYCLICVAAVISGRTCLFFYTTVNIIWRNQKLSDLSL